MRFHISKYDFFAPSLHTIDDWKLWAEGKKDIGADDSDCPDVSFVPPMQKRKMSQLARIVTAIAERLSGREEMPAVYSSAFGEWGMTLKQLHKYREEKEVSPTGFGLSVHNAAVGQYSILSKNKKAYNCISGTGNDFDAGLIEAVAMLPNTEKVLYISACEKIPDLYKATFDERLLPFGIGLLLSREKAGSAFDIGFDAPPLNVDDFKHCLKFIKFLLTDEKKFSGSNYVLEKFYE